MALEKATLWLKFASWVLIGFGILSAISAHPSFNFLSRPFIHMAVWPTGEPSEILTTETRLLWAIVGGISIGWGVLALLLTTRLLHKEPQIVRSIMLSSTLAWFAADGLASILSGAAFNAVLNISFLALFLPPVWRPIVPGSQSKTHVNV